jgi:hypothetical protein
MRIDIIHNDQDVGIEVQHDYTPADPGCRGGLPENCYPPERDE